MSGLPSSRTTGRIGPAPTPRGCRGRRCPRVAAWADQLRRELERPRNANGLERAIGPGTVGQLHDLCDRVIATIVDRYVGAKPPSALETAVGEIDRDDPTRA